QRWWYLRLELQSSLEEFSESHQRCWWYFRLELQSPLEKFSESHQQRWWYFRLELQSSLEKFSESHQRCWWYFITILQVLLSQAGKGDFQQQNFLNPFVEWFDFAVLRQRVRIVTGTSAGRDRTDALQQRRARIV